MHGPICIFWDNLTPFSLKCWADDYCVAGVFTGASCWMKYNTKNKQHKPGVSACVTTKTPKPVPKPHHIETHGPYNHGNGWMAVNISPYPRAPPFPAKARTRAPPAFHWPDKSRHLERQM
jgi:hypothetical protein